MEGLYGTYRGYTPSDDSGLGVGEMRVDIDEMGLHVAVATGTRVDNEYVESNYLRLMNEHEIAADFVEGADYDGVDGIVVGDSGVRLLFLAPLVDESGRVVVVRGLMGEEVFGPSCLISSDRGFEAMVTSLEEQLGIHGDFPLLSSGGRAPNSNT